GFLSNAKIRGDVAEGGSLQNIAFCGFKGFVALLRILKLEGYDAAVGLVKEVCEDVAFYFFYLGKFLEEAVEAVLRDEPQLSVSQQFNTVHRRFLFEKTLAGGHKIIFCKK